MEENTSDYNNHIIQTRHYAIIAIVIAILFLWFTYTPAGILGKADAIGYAVCHRIKVRSFNINGRQMPMCARCTGMYIGAFIGLLYQALIGKRKVDLPSPKILITFVMLALIWLVDGLNSYLHLFPNAPTFYEPNNTLRLLTGSGIGIVASGLLYPAFNQTVWQSRDSESASINLFDLSLLIILTLGLDGLLLTENPLILYAAAIISSLGTIVLLTMVYGMIWLMLFKIENRFRSFRQLWLPLIIAFGIAIMQIGLFDLIRFWFTGNWNGFGLTIETTFL
jgi:uncharacterized membrane protein